MYGSFEPLRDTSVQQIRNLVSTFIAGRKTHARDQFLFVIGLPSANLFLLSLGLLSFTCWWLVGTVIASVGLLCQILSYVIGYVFFVLPKLIRLVLATASISACMYFAAMQRWWLMALFFGYVAFSLMIVLDSKTRSRETRLIISPAVGLAYIIAFDLMLNSWLSGFFLLILFHSLSNRVIDGVGSAEVEANQRAREWFARSVYASIRRGVDPRTDYALYLRPFWVTGRQKPVDDAAFEATRDGTSARDFQDAQTGKWVRTEMPIFQGQVGVSLRQSTFEQNEEFESAVERSFAFAGTLLALGAPGEAVGAARVSVVEADWKAAIIALTQSANICIVIPSENPGTLWEIRRLVQYRLLNKCCFIMPPRTFVFDYSLSWHAVALEVSDALVLPPYDDAGMLFVYAADGRLITLPFESGQLPKHETIEGFCRANLTLDDQHVSPRASPDEREGP